MGHYTKIITQNDVLFSLLELDEKIWSTYHENCEFEYVPDLEELCGRIF